MAIDRPLSAEIDRRTLVKQLAMAVMLSSSGLKLQAAQETGAKVRVLPEGTLPQDSRLGPLRDLNGYFPFHPPETLADWLVRAEQVRRRMLVACGLWPMPPRPPVEAVIHGPVERDEYTVEKVFFQSAPGLYVTGNLYRPKGRDGKLPVVICPHGHWANGRFFDHGEQGVAREIASGAEKFPVGGRYPLQARCVQLARMGCLVFHYDMLGYADSVPFTQQVAHGLREQRANLQSPERWGIFSAQAELRLINILGLQTFNSIRVLDWLLQLPEVDSTRIGVTGASGGGTQTFMLAAVDDRVTAAFPAVMVSTAMQGGCTCENACYLRIETGNIEFAGLCAPRPLAMTAANDWTREIETKGLPELKQLYRLWGVEDRVQAKYFNFGHNYNYVSRAMMYEFFNKHFQLGIPTPIEERDFTPLSIAEMTVWNEQYPKPAQDEEAELAMLRSWDETWHRQWKSLLPQSPEQWPSFQKMLLGAFDIMIGRSPPQSDHLEWELRREHEVDGALLRWGLLSYRPVGEQIPGVVVLPNRPVRHMVVFVHPHGKTVLFTESGALQPVVRKWLDQGIGVISIDTLYTGEFITDEPLQQTRRVDNPREIAAYTLGYNHSLFAQRAHDVMSAAGFARKISGADVAVYLVGIGVAAAWCAAAAVQLGQAVDGVALWTDQFRFAPLTDIRHPDFWPGALKYGDLPGLLGACAPLPMLIASEPELPDLTALCYRAAGSPGRVILSRAATVDEFLQQAARWITRA